MTDFATFYQAICENPDDMMMRLVFADWLEEQGEPRAEFIRVQCELANQETPAQELLNREAELWEENRREWNGPLHRFLSEHGLRNLVSRRRKPIRGWNYRCGFPEELTVHMDLLLEYHEVLLQLGPIRHLNLLKIGASGVDEPIGQLRKLSVIDQLETLHLDFDLSCFDGVNLLKFFQDERVCDLKLLTGRVPLPQPPLGGDLLALLSQVDDLTVQWDSIYQQTFVFQRKTGGSGQKIDKEFLASVREQEIRHSHLFGSGGGFSQPAWYHEFQASPAEEQTLYADHLVAPSLLDEGSTDSHNSLDSPEVFFARLLGVAAWSALWILLASGLVNWFHSHFEFRGTSEPQKPIPYPAPEEPPLRLDRLPL